LIGFKNILEIKAKRLFLDGIQMVNPESFSRIYVNAMNTGESDGSIVKPFATIAEAVTAMVAMTTATGFVLDIAYGAYAESAAATFPNKPMVVYGNNATVTFSAGLTIPHAQYTRYDLNTVGDIAFTGATAGKAIVQGGSITGNVTLSSGVYMDIKTATVSSVSKAFTVSSGATAVFIGCICTIKVTGAGTIMLENNHWNTGYAGYLITSTSGGIINAINNIIVNSNGAGGGISCDNGATTAPNSIFGNAIAAVTPVACGTAVTIYGKNSLSGGARTGAGYIPVSDDIIGPSVVVLGSDATGDLYYRAATTGLLTRIPIGTTGQVLKVVAGVPAWADA